MTFSRTDRTVWKLNTEEYGTIQNIARTQECLVVSRMIYADLCAGKAHLMNCHVLWDSDAAPIQIYRDHIQQIRCRGITEKCLSFNRTKAICAKQCSGSAIFWASKIRIRNYL